MAADVPYDCRQCINAHAARHGFPPLDGANEFAWHLFQEIEDQVRIGMDVVGLDYGVLPAVFDCYLVPAEERPLLFGKLVVLNRAQQGHRARQREFEKSRHAEAETQRIADGR